MGDQEGGEGVAQIRNCEEKAEEWVVMEGEPGLGGCEMDVGV